jgi:ATP-dependent DNA helicase RecQ
VNPNDVLRQYWGYTEFKGSQHQIIQAVLDQRDVLALLPTGGGKSVCYQVPALLKEGLCIVVSPLIALIQDQVASLKQKGIKAVALTGGLPEEEVINLLDNCQYGNYKFLYLSPERLRQAMVQERISRVNVNLIAVDEAHCISQWGNDFRPAYLDCSVLRDLKPNTPVIALTATATKEVASEIVQNLRLSDCITFKDSFLRSNIVFRVVRAEDKEYRLKQLCTRRPESGIVYVRTRRLAETLAGILRKNGCTATYYHGGISRKEKEDSLKQWMSSKVRFMVATNAFGMGVDKPDVGLVVHYQIPDSLENYFQEAGRAGRDGRPAQALLISNAADEIQLRKQFLSTLPDAAFLKKLYKTLNNYFQIPYGTGENTTHNFHFNSFCHTYKLNTLITYNGLLALDQHSVIALSQQFKRKTTVQFIASKAQIWSYLEKQQTLAPLIQIVLRTYGGIFDFETKINTFLIARKGNVQEEEVLRMFNRLQKDGIIEYQAQQGDLEITFLVPREDERTINHFAPQLQKHQQVRIKHVEQMLAYIHNTRRCRNKQLLEYFGERINADCGKCDVCLVNKSVPAAAVNSVQQEIMQLLRSGAMSSRAIISALRTEEGTVLNALQLLLEDGQIEISATNKYTLT